MNYPKFPLNAVLLASALGAMPLVVHAATGVNQDTRITTQASVQQNSSGAGISNRESFEIAAQDQDQATLSVQDPDNAATPAVPTIQPGTPNNPIAADEVADHRPDIDYLDRDHMDRDDLDTNSPDMENPNLARPDIDRPNIDRPDIARPDIERPEMDR
ncbi:MAG: hypothetical protein ACYDB1_08695 [Acidiferrobacteraceae bacterium]